MCIRDRPDPLVAFGLRHAPGAVSYTHLDVYKRQELNMALALQDAGRFRINVFKQRGEAVSYTHLDVYKRQAMLELPSADGLAKPGAKAALPRVCLLYTSRCV